MTKTALKAVTAMPEVLLAAERELLRPGQRVMLGCPQNEAERAEFESVGTILSVYCPLEKPHREIYLVKFDAPPERPPMECEYESLEKLHGTQGAIPRR